MARRKLGPRYSDGSLKKAPKPEREQDIKGVVIAYRRRLHGAEDRVIKDEDGRNERIGVDDPLWGSVLGRMYADGILSLAQREAAIVYGLRRSDWLRLKSEQNPNPASPGFQMVSRGLSCEAEPDDEVTFRKIRRHEDMRRELEELDRFDGPSTLLDTMELLDRITLLEREIAYTPANIGRVRGGLNLLARLFRMER